MSSEASSTTKKNKLSVQTYLNILGEQLQILDVKNKKAIHSKH
jgi:hypothetical protein